jgi:hypothetical protein
MICSESTLLHPPEQPDEKEWLYARGLGGGETGQVGMRVKLDKSDKIVDRIAVKDINQIGISWTNPLYWRDRLPRDIAIQKRLNNQGGHRNIPRLRGYIFSMPQRKYLLETKVEVYEHLRLTRFPPVSSSFTQPFGGTSLANATGVFRRSRLLQDYAVSKLQQ